MRLATYRAGPPRDMRPFESVGQIPQAVAARTWIVDSPAHFDKIRTISIPIAITGGRIGGKGVCDDNDRSSVNEPVEPILPDAVVRIVRNHWAISVRQDHLHGHEWMSSEYQEHGPSRRIQG